MNAKSRTKARAEDLHIARGEEEVLVHGRKGE